MTQMGRKCNIFCLAIASIVFWNIFNKSKGVYVFMVDMYVALVIAGRRTCNTNTKNVVLVPVTFRSHVITELEALGLDADGKPTEV